MTHGVIGADKARPWCDWNLMHPLDHRKAKRQQEKRLRRQAREECKLDADGRQVLS